MSLALLILGLVLLGELVGWLGSEGLLNVTYSAYLSCFHSSKTRRQRALKADILAKKQELMRTSSQDQFAKWAKLRRQVDKGLSELEQLNGDLATLRTSFSIKFKSFLWLLTSGLSYGIGTYYRRTPVFWLPPGWFGPLAWWLSWPWAPSGSVSCAAWSMVCRRVVRYVEEMGKDLFGGGAPASSPAVTSSKKTRAKAGDESRFTTVEEESVVDSNKAS